MSYYSAENSGKKKAYIQKLRNWGVSKRSTV